MAVIRVVPLPDGTTLRGNWQVKKNGRRIPKHRKKRAARRRARQEKGPNDRIVIHRRNGTVMG